jgi:predicted nucleotidyltransferase
MNFGLRDEDVDLIRRFFLNFPQITTVKVYGSRAMGNYRPGSDIDLAIFGDVDWNLVGHIRAEIDELPLPYKFDITDYQGIDNHNLKTHIDTIGKVIYEKT